MTEPVDRMERELWAAHIASPRDSARYVAAMEVAVRVRLAEPEVARNPSLDELYLRMISEYGNLGRWDDALAAADALAETASSGLNPDPRCKRAEVLMRMGRVDEAEPIWAALRNEMPRDEWLFYTAGRQYADLGDHRTALEWLTEGVRLALRTHDETEDPLTEDLATLRRRSLENLGHPIDALQEEVIALLRRDFEKRWHHGADYIQKPGERPLRPKRSRSTARSRGRAVRDAPTSEF
ncbi:hypothetical protein GR927_29805 [Mycolicibacterium sp. 3033]|nr:hypothetical protein [Mycolicibacterium aurantiacum]